MPIKSDYVYEEEEEDYSMAKNDAVYMIGETYESLLAAVHCVIMVILSPIMAIAYFITESVDIADIILEFVNSIWTAIGCYFRIVGYTFITMKNFLIYPAFPNYEMLDIKKIYHELKIVTDRLRITPFPQRECIVLHIFLRKFPRVIWDNILPFPDVFFQDSISRIQPVGENVLATYVTEVTTSKNSSILESTSHFENLS